MGAPGGFCRFSCVCAHLPRARLFAALLLTAACVRTAMAQESPEPAEAFHWSGALLQSSLFLGVQHSFRLATEPGTRSELKGPFWREYGRSVRGIEGWGD